MLLIVAFMWGSCAKTKPNFSTSGNQVSTNQITSSSARIVNLYGYTDLIVNGTPLTDMLFPQAPGEIINPTPTAWFPTTGKLGQTYNVPEQFFNAQHTANVALLEGYAVSTPIDTLSRRFTVTDNYSSPFDYYDVPYRKGVTQSEANIQVYSDSVFVIPRPISPAANPTHALVRLLNLSSSPDAANLVGGMRLAYANGSHVATGAADSLTSPGNYSGYIEIPYGTYQFKVLTANNVQVPSAQQDVVSNSAGLTITESMGTVNGSPLTYAPLVTYQPGGVYTIVVNTNNDFQVPYGNQALPSASNSFWIITDITPQANVTYGRVQVANAIPGISLNVSVDGQSWPDAVNYPGAGAYQVLVNGTHQVQVSDQSGKVLVSKTLSLNGGDNITAWVYPSPSGSDSIVFVQNNLSGNYYNGGTGDGSDASTSQFHINCPFWIRFLNLCPDLPYVTFTQGNGYMWLDNPTYATSALAAQNLTPGGLPDTYFQYVSGVGYTMPDQIEAYQSQPLILPGDWLSDIPALVAGDFSSGSTLIYPYGLPVNGEPGVYTVALVGRYGSGGTGAQMIIVKHNQ